eukprot:gene10913-51910_t
MRCRGAALLAALPAIAAAPDVPTIQLRNGARLPMVLLGVGNAGTWGNATGTERA